MASVLRRKGVLPAATGREGRALKSAGVGRKRAGTAGVECWDQVSEQVCESEWAHEHLTLGRVSA
eukprot:3523787-Pleurochrysis_carterae.AAC.1